MEYFNKIGLEKYNNKSIIEKINLLLCNAAFFVYIHEKEEFMESLSLIDLKNLKESEHDKEIINILQLKYNQNIVDEIYEVVISDIKKHSFPKTYNGCELIDNYNLELMSSINSKMKLKIIGKKLKKTIKSLNYFCRFETPLEIDINEHLTQQNLYTIIEEFYKNTDNFCSIDYTPILELKGDVITHLTAPCNEPDILMYKSACNFMVIDDYLCFIDFLKNELIKEQHLQLTVIGTDGSKYYIDNVIKKENRFPLVFKNAYTCELFLYTLSFILNPKPIIFSYYFEIFTRFNYLKKNVKISDYLAFINSVYGLNESRIRKELPNRKDDLYVNQLIKREKEFKLKTSIKPTI